MFKVIYKGELYDVCEVTEHCYVSYDLRVGYMVYLPKEECEVI